MSYKLNKTDGSLLVELVDGRLDTNTADVALIGKNYQGFGEFLNENFIKILESFANTAPPSKALKGQLWYDTAEGRLKVYDGTTFKSTDSTIFSSTQPSSLTQGDIWINGTTNQMYFWDGLEAVLVGPGYTKTQLKSGNEVSTIKDTAGQNKIVIKFYIGGSLVGIYTKSAFTPFPAISGFTNLATGFNISSAFSDFAWQGKALSAEQLIDDVGNTYTKDSFLSATSNDVTTGNLTINNNTGISIGADNRFSITKESTHTIFRNNGTNNELRIKLKDGVGEYMGARFDAVNKRLALFKETAPDYTLDVAGSMRLTGDLIVEGNTVYMDVTNLRVEDKLIELGIQSDSTILDDANVSGGGITLVSLDGSKDITWSNVTGAWTSNQSFDLSNDTSSYKIDTVDVLDKTTLGSTVVNSSLTSIGTLTSLDVDNITLDGYRLSSSSVNGLEISTIHDIALVNPQFITNVKKPVSLYYQTYFTGTESDDGYVATKGYVDQELIAATTILPLDATGLGAAGFSIGGALENNLKGLLLTLLPTTERAEYATVRILASQTSASTDPIDVNSNINKSSIAVDSAGVQNVSVLQDISISPDPTTTVTFTITRYIIEFSNQSSDWVWQSTVTYP
jgi:hypothetical protein